MGLGRYLEYLNLNFGLFVNFCSKMVAMEIFTEQFGCLSASPAFLSSVLSGKNNLVVEHCMSGEAVQGCWQ